MTVRRLALAALVCTVTLAACADVPPGPSQGTPTPSTGAADELVLRLSYEGGFVPAEWNVLALPAFSLYADGTVITPGAQIAIHPAPALPAISERHVDAAAIEAIVARAIDAGLGGDDVDLSDTGDVAIADAHTAVFTLVRDGRISTARVYALGLEDPGATPGLSEDDAERRRAFADLAAALGDLSWVTAAGGTLGDEVPYAGDAAITLVAPVRREPGLPQQPVEWPLDANLRSLGSPVPWAERTACAVLEGGEWEAVRAVAADANQLTPWVDGPVERSLAFRPLLPDERGC